MSAEPVIAKVVLIGPMAAGKTRLGKKIARILDVEFIDTDRLIVHEHGPITALFDTFGEAHFRMLEREAVGQALRQDAVVSLGGGAVLDADTRAELSDVVVVFLTVSADAVAHRLRGTKRPLVRDGIEAWSRIFAERRPYYEELSDISFDTSTRDLDRIAQEIVQWLRQRESPSSAQKEHP